MKRLITLLQLVVLLLVCGVMVTLEMALLNVLSKVSGLL